MRKGGTHPLSIIISPTLREKKEHELIYVSLQNSLQSLLPTPNKAHLCLPLVFSLFQFYELFSNILMGSAF